MYNRRAFVSKFTKGFSGALLLPGLDKLTTNHSASIPQGNPEEEQYWNDIRSLFPLNKGFSFLNTATMGPSPYSVIEAESKTNLFINAEARHGGNEKEALTNIARLVKAKKENIALTHNATEGINIGVWSLNLQKGDEVIISTHEHVGNAVPWLNRARLDGIILKPIMLMPTAAEMLELVMSSVNAKTKVIALPHIPCTTGQVLPIKAICHFARQKGIYTIIDGAHGPGMLRLDLPDMGCDMYASCCHKWMLGPKGTGFIYINDNSIVRAIPKFIGAFGDTGWDMLSTPPLLNDYVPTAHKFFYGTQSASQYAGISSAIQFLEKIGIDKIEKRTRDLAAYLQQQLINIGEDKIEMLTPVEEISRAAIIAFRVKKAAFTEVQKLCTDRKIAIRGVAENNVNCLRVSTHIYNNYNEIDTLVEVIKGIA